MFGTPQFILPTQAATHLTHPRVPETPDPSPGVCQPHPWLVLAAVRHE